ncbi:uncharacterized protein KY384_003474 [Bacidia gigantensis]|uniref:uncharacterized protein n=1 Tax=Bacidia gigantensis TaxID=2732470 RepID=UPI001D03FC8B|nr:uncharacterized protein KY384_003474 [Bacidia gigantensis]KAG8531838.1 hypothetical protein KY384_003474 [Bacidia gigantensis]
MFDGYDDETKSATIDNVDKETFGRVIEFAYRQNYYVPAATSQASACGQGGVNDAKVDANDNGPNNGTTSEASTPVLTPSSSSANTVAPSDAPEPNVCASLNDSFLPKTEEHQATHNSKEFGLTEVLLCHARVYVFAKNNGCDWMKERASDMVYARLDEGYPTMIDDTIPLLRYMYDHVGPADSGGPDRLYGVLREFIGRQLRSIIKNKSFMTLVRENDMVQEMFMKEVEKKLTKLDEVSKPWKILARGETFYVHHDILQSLFDPPQYIERFLRVADYNERQAVVMIKGVNGAYDHPAFARCLQFAYEGCYTVSPAFISSSDDADSSAAVMTPCSSAATTILAKSKEMMKHAFKVMYQSHAAQSQANLPCENYTNIFLCHAEVYVFAASIGMKKLEQYALHQLHTTLVNFVLYKERVGDVVALIKYAYKYTTDVSVAGCAEEALGKIIRVYVGSEMEIFMKNNEFQKLVIEDGGRLLADFMAQVEMRISD